jgi:anti-sigma regulatory factor (Ser/Thr protein kinase)
VTEAVHEAVLYSSPADLAALLAERVGPAVAAGEPVLAVLDEANSAALRKALGRAAGGVEFQDPARVHLLPAFTVAVRWARLSRRATTADRRATVIGQHLDGLPGTGCEHWARLDMAVDVATEGLPITVLCPYPKDGANLHAVHSTHRWLSDREGARHSTDYRPPREAVVEYPPPPPPELGPPDLEMPFTAAELSRLRHQVADDAAMAGLDGERISDIVLAVNEIVSNSIEHGPGSGVLRIWRCNPDFIAEVTDSGHMNVPFPGLSVPPPRGDRGRGLWLASELSDVLQVWSGDGGTIVRLRMDR